MTLQEIEWQQYEFSVKFQLHSKNPFGNEPLICTADCHVCRSWRLGLPRELFNNLRYIIIEESWIPFEKIMLSASMAFWAHRPGGWGWGWVGGTRSANHCGCAMGRWNLVQKWNFGCKLGPKNLILEGLIPRKRILCWWMWKIPPKHCVQSSEGQKKGGQNSGTYISSNIERVPSPGHRPWIVWLSLDFHVKSLYRWLTHLPLVPHICVSKLGQHLFR